MRSKYAFKWPKDDNDEKIIVNELVTGPLGYNLKRGSSTNTIKIYLTKGGRIISLGCFGCGERNIWY